MSSGVSAILNCNSLDLFGPWKAWHKKYDACFCQSTVIKRSNCKVICKASYSTVIALDDVSSCTCVNQLMVGGSCDQRACLFDRTGTLCRKVYGRAEVCDRDTPMRKRDIYYPSCKCMHGGIASTNYCLCKSPYTGKLCEDVISTKAPVTTTDSTTDGSGISTNNVMFIYFSAAALLFLTIFVVRCVYQRLKYGTGEHNSLSFSLFRTPVTTYVIEQREPILQPRPAQPRYVQQLLPGHIQISYESTYPGQQRPHVHTPGRPAFPNNDQCENRKLNPQGTNGSDAEPSAPIAEAPHRNQTMSPLRYEIVIPN